jgi:hypothetical protein
MSDVLFRQIHGRDFICLARTDEDFQDVVLDSLSQAAGVLFWEEHISELSELGGICNGHKRTTKREWG